ncbi:MAG: hypothetical protein AB1717_01405 [Pseudomonadota bacterium]
MKRIGILFLLVFLAPVAHAEISVNATLSNPAPWVREETLLTLEVVDDRSLLDMQIEEWTPQGFALRKLNPSETRVQTAQGVRILRQQRWALMPLYAGNISLQPPTLHLRTTGQVRSTLTPQALQLEARPLNPLIPSDVPVSSLQIKQDALPTAAARGRPFEIKFNILGSGLSARGLNRWLNESLHSSPTLRIYPPQVRIIDNLDPQRPLLQQAEVRLTLESQASGFLQLPAIILPFVDVQGGQIRQANIDFPALQVEHPLWLALRAWSPWIVALLTVLAASLAAWRILPARWRRRQRRRAILHELEAADTPKSLRAAWKKAVSNLPESAATRRLDAACYGQNPLNEQQFAQLKSELSQAWRKTYGRLHKFDQANGCQPKTGEKA